jgi:DNA-binding NarL/FixJ family response regulator
MNSKIKVAIVDDHLLFRKGLALLIESFDYSIHLECSNGEELITILNKNDLPDIILMDLKMPIMDGFETILWLKKNYPSIPVLVLTMYDDEKFIIHAMETGANGYLLKSATPGEVQKAIEMVIQNGYYFNDLVNAGLLKNISKSNNKPSLQTNVELTQRELEVLKLICEDKTVTEISSEIFLSPRTVEGIRTKLIEKIGARNTAGLVMYAVKNGVLELEPIKGKQVKPTITEQPDEDNANAFEDEMSSTIYAPKQAVQGESFLIQVFAHTSNQTALLEDIAKGVDEDAKWRITTPLQKEIKKQTKLTFELLIQNLQIEEPVQTAFWNGDIVSVQFEVKVPTDHPIGDIICTVIVSEKSIPIGHLKFKLKILAVSPTITASQINQNAYTGNLIRYKQAFISYASEDRKEVLKRVQMLNLVKLKFFQDLLTLEPGDNWSNPIHKYIDECDVFFLFWSLAASRSDWVRKEVKYAVTRKTESGGAAPEIIPVIIEGPPPAKPPAELSFLHFNDKLTYFI